MGELISHPLAKWIFTLFASRGSKTCRNTLVCGMPLFRAEGILSPFFTYHTLADDDVHNRPFHRILPGVRLLAMTKTEVLSIFDRANGFLPPDQVRAQLR